jgi:hypothetical protein
MCIPLECFYIKNVYNYFHLLDINVCVCVYMENFSWKRSNQVRMKIHLFMKEDNLFIYMYSLFVLFIMSFVSWCLLLQPWYHYKVLND